MMDKIPVKIKQLARPVLMLIIAFIETLFTWKQIGQDANMVIYVLIFVAFFMLVNKAMQVKDKRMWITSAVLGLLFTIAEIIGSSINTDFTLNHIFKVRTILYAAGYFLSATMIVVLLYNWINQFNEKAKQKNKLLSPTLKWFLIGMVCILLAWLPYFLRYFPGLTTADSMDQIYQTIGYSSLRDNHPIIHTLIVSIFMNIGQAIGSYPFGVASYIVFQMCAMAAIFSFTVYYMGKKELPLAVRVITLLYFMFYPVNALFNVIMWKDILFGGIILLLTIFTYEWVTNKENFNKKTMICYGLIVLATTLLRNNGLYVILLMFPIMLIACRKDWKKVLLVFGVAILLSFGIKNILFSVFHVEKGLAKEALSIPMQQIARVVKYHGDELSQEEKEQIYQFIPVENVGELYNPVISDPVKREFDNDAFLENKTEFIGLWANLLMRYPMDYIEAFFSNNYGYWYPEAKHWVANRTMERDDILHLTSTPLIEGKLVEKIDAQIENRSIPILAMAFSIGFTFWLIMVSLFYMIYQKKYAYLLVYLPVLLLWLTTLASPVFCEFRYVYGLFTSVPFLLSMMFQKNTVEKASRKALNAAENRKK